MYCKDQYIAPIYVVVNRMGLEPMVVNRMGLEPMTPTLKVLCSTS